MSAFDDKRFDKRPEPDPPREPTYRQGECEMCGDLALLNASNMCAECAEFKRLFVPAPYSSGGPPPIKEA